MKNSPSWRGRNVSETVAIHRLPRTYGARNDINILRARNDEKKNGAHNDSYCLSSSDEICY
jgi:hypothetical protein